MTRFLRICLVLVGILPSCRAESWTISVHTGRKRYAGTDSNVYIRLFDPRDVSSREYHLTHRNWIPENNAILIRNLFEMGAHDRFHIRTEGIKTVAKITIRRDNYPLLQPDWLLDQVIVKRDDDDSARYVFTCNCWLRGEQLQVTLSALPDAQSDKRNKTDAAASSYKRAFVAILLLFICTVIGVFCCYNEYRRRQQQQQQQHSPPPSSGTSPPDLHGPSLLDECQPQPAAIESRADYWMNTLRQWKTLPQRFSTDRHARTPQPVSTAVPPDEPPSYEDLYPNQNAPMNNRSNF